MEEKEWNIFGTYAHCDNTKARTIRNLNLFIFRQKLITKTKVDMEKDNMRENMCVHKEQALWGVAVPVQI